MHSRNLSGYCLVAALAFALPIIGCSGQKRETSGSAGESRLAAALRDIGGAPAALAVSEPMRPFFAAGLGFILLGGITICIGGKGAGLSLMGLGLATTATGVLFVQYPWAVLALALLAGIVAAFAVRDRLRAARRLAESAGELERNRAALETTAEAIQNAPEGKAIKARLAELGSEAEAALRAVIDPIKEKLRREGRIE